MKDEPDESTLQPVVDRIRKCFGDIRINLRLVVGADQVEQASRVIGEATAIGQVPHKANTRPACGRHVLIGRTNPARVRKSDEVLNLDSEAAFHNRLRNWVTGYLCLDCARSPDRK